MPDSIRRAAAASLACSVAAIVACSSHSSVRSCTTADECPATAWCISGACVANAPPSVAVSVPAPLETNALASFDASASSDGDAGDAVVSFAWAFRPGSGTGCAAPTVASADPIAIVRFGCAGRYAVDVTATDRLGATSTATREFDVVEHQGASLVTVGADVTVDHVCTSGPLCTTKQPVTLSAGAPGYPPDALTFTWTVLPPSDRALSPTRRVSFSPSASVPAPSVSIETDGDAISGDWIFQVEVRDAAGVIGTAPMRVSVLNQPPSVVANVPQPDHAFDGAQFTSAGEVPFTVSDPDGDPLADPSVQWHHVGDGASSTFTGFLLNGPPRATFQVVVPYAAPEDALHLIGGDGLSRTMLFAVEDVNGARVVDTWSIAVANRPPAPVATPASVTVGHGYDAPGARYVADATVATWVDPDGDPLLPGDPATGNAVCSSYDVVGGDVVVHCSAPYPGTPHPAAIVGTWPVSFGVRDPWTPAAAGSSAVQVVNRAPRLPASVTAYADCGVGACCRTNIDGECTAWNHTIYDGNVTVYGAFIDDDGDPLLVTVNGTASGPCVASSCTASGWLPMRSLACGYTSTTDTWTLAADDGAATASGSVTVVRRCQ